MPPNGGTYDAQNYDGKNHPNNLKSNGIESKTSTKLMRIRTSGSTFCRAF